jgi:8-oxo-dGTP pyrophosphatase MutT (NUDIX family)
LAPAIRFLGIQQSSLAVKFNVSLLTMYDDFIKLLESKLGKDLPGDLSHQKMMSYSRPTAAEAFNHKIPPRKSGVLLLLYPKGDEMHTVFIKRPSYKGVHSAQISFPGGRHEPEDSDLEETALREAEEEVGVKRKDDRRARDFYQELQSPHHRTDLSGRGPHHLGGNCNDFGRVQGFDCGLVSTLTRIVQA